MSTLVETAIPMEDNRLEKIRPLLDELCGSRATPVGDDTPSKAPSATTVPPTGIQDSTDGVGGGGCWVARAVYGPDNPRWMQFRSWLFNEAPAWFRNFYLRHGQQIARWIAPHEGVKWVIRSWMDSRIRRN